MMLELQQKLPQLCQLPNNYLDSESFISKTSPTIKSFSFERCDVIIPFVRFHVNVMSNHHQFFKNSSTQCMKVTQKIFIPKVSYAIKCLNFKIKKLQKPNTNRIRIVSENANCDRRNRKIQIQMIFNHCVLERTALSYSVIDKKKYF